MSFDFKKFGKLDSSFSGKTCDWWSYKDSLVTIAQVTAAGFFAELAEYSMVNEGDSFKIKVSDGDYLYNITVVTSTDITIAREDGFFSEAGGLLTPDTSTNSIGVATGESFFINGVDINDAGTLSNVAYLDQANVFTELQSGITPSVDANFAIKSYVDDSVNSVVRTATVTLSSANILALRATPITLVAAQGADTVIRYLGATLRLVYGTSAYTESADNITVKYTNGSGVAVSETIEATNFIDQTANTLTSSKPALNAIVAETGASNQALVLHNTGDGEYAAGDGTLVVYIDYQVISVA